MLTSDHSVIIGAVCGGVLLLALGVFMIRRNKDNGDWLKHMDMFTGRDKDDSSMSSGASSRPMLQAAPWDNSHFQSGDPYGGATGMQPQDMGMGQVMPPTAQNQQPFAQPGQPLMYGQAESVHNGQQPSYPTSMASSTSQDYAQQESWMQNQNQVFMPHEHIGHEEPPSPTRTKWMGSAAVCTPIPPAKLCLYSLLGNFDFS